jgi:hypothetical protein
MSQLGALTEFVLDRFQAVLGLLSDRKCSGQMIRNLPVRSDQVEQNAQDQTL